MTLNELVTELQQRTGLGRAEIREVVRRLWMYSWRTRTFKPSDVKVAEFIIRQNAAPLSEGQGRV